MPENFDSSPLGSNMPPDEQLGVLQSALYSDFEASSATEADGVATPEEMTAAAIALRVQSRPIEYVAEPEAPWENDPDVNACMARLLTQLEVALDTQPESFAAD